MKAKAVNKTVTTTFALPLELRSGLDQLKARRAKIDGRWSSSTALVVEALKTFLEKELGRPA